MTGMSPAAQRWVRHTRPASPNAVRLLCLPSAFVAAHVPPHVPAPEPPIHALPEDEFLVRLRRYGGAQEGLFDDADARAVLLPNLRADFALFERYACAADPPFSCPISVFGGYDDDSVPAHLMHAWRRLTTGPFRFRMWPGDHFFLEPQAEQVIGAVRADLARHACVAVSEGDRT